MNKLFVLGTSLFCAALAGQTAGQVDFFEKRIRPILADKCAACHNAKATVAGLDLSTTDGIRYAVQYGGEAGKLISLDKPDESLLMQAVEYQGRLKMPPSGKLKEDQLEDLRVWVQAGAPVPGAVQAAKTRVEPAEGKPPSASAPGAAIRPKRQFTEAEKSFWAFQKVPSV